MLTAESRLDPVVAPRTVRVEVSAAVVRLALSHVAQSAGWRTCAHAGSCGCLLLTDVGGARNHRSIRVVRDTPAECLDALELVMNGHACSLVLWNEPEALVAIFEAVRHSATVIPNRIIELATLAPRLSERQRSTLRLLASGRSNRGVAATLQQSVSTSKRDIAELLQIFDVPNRAALMSTATSLGFVE